MSSLEAAEPSANLSGRMTSKVWQTPIIHEVKMAVESLQDLAQGDPASAKMRSQAYVNHSVLGSSLASFVALCRGEKSEAERLGRESGRALGEVPEALTGSKVPLLHELAMAGKSLRLVAEDKPTEANQVWTQEYAGKSVFGSLVIGVKEAVQGHSDDATQNLNRSQEAFEEADNSIQRWEHLAALLPLGPIGSVLSTWSLVRQLRQFPRNENADDESPASDHEPPRSTAPLRRQVTI